MKNLIIDKDFKYLLPPLTPDEYTGLEKDIVKRGILDPVIIWNDIIIDGHNRYSIALAHHIENIPMRETTFDSKADAMQWIIDHQASRRNLLKSQYVRAFEAVRTEREKEAAKKLRPGRPKKLSSNLNSISDPIRTSAEIAKKIGVSENTYRDMRLIVNKGTPEQIERMDKGGHGNGVSAIAQEIKDIGVTTKVCKSCGAEYPISRFYPGRNVCKQCDNKRRTASFRYRDAKGAIIGTSGRFNSVPDEEMVSGLLDSGDKKIEVTIEDVVEEFLANFNQAMISAERTLDSNSEIVNKNKKGIRAMWQKADDQFQQIRRKYA